MSDGILLMNLVSSYEKPFRICGTSAAIFAIARTRTISRRYAQSSGGSGTSGTSRGGSGASGGSPPRAGGGSGSGGMGGKSGDLTTFVLRQSRFTVK